MEGEPMSMKEDQSLISAYAVIIGGGIAGVSCVETLSFLCPDISIILLTQSSLIKTVTNLVPLAKSLTRFDIIEKEAAGFFKKNIKVLTDSVTSIDSVSKRITTKSGRIIEYKLLCVCCGGQPKLIEQYKDNRFVVGIRDTESAKDFQHRIQQSRRILIVGNGGIASEVVYELDGITIDWVIKDRFISQTFVDPGAAEFFLRQLKCVADHSPDDKSIIKRIRYGEEMMNRPAETNGPALGPDWHKLLNLKGCEERLTKTISIHYETEVVDIEINTQPFDFPITVTLSDTKRIDCDLVLSATGVTPNLQIAMEREQFTRGSDGGISVDEYMKTSVTDIYAAGDCCTADWKWADYWFQMRLWTQARQMGSMAGKSMASVILNEPTYQDFCFELFGHVTELYGFQVVLLGKYNGQGLGTEYEILLRTTPGKEYIKYVIKDGRVVGAILIGDTGLEETTENLILNGTDVSGYGDDLLNPDVDIEDYFD